jgi:RNA polymerase sigma factor (sigma-70 family)
MNDPTPVVQVVDDDDSLRQALTRLLRAAGYVVRAYPSAGEFLLERRLNTPGCLVLDIQMPGPSGLDLQKALAEIADPPAIIFLSGHGDIPMSVRAMKAGAIDFLTKPVQRDVLLGAVRQAVARDQEKRLARQRHAELRARCQTLTPRERAVFQLVVSGNLNKQVAAELGMSERTVKAHRARVMEKLQADSLAELVRIAEQLGEVEAVNLGPAGAAGRLQPAGIESRTRREP